MVPDGERGGRAVEQRAQLVRRQTVEVAKHEESPVMLGDTSQGPAELVTIQGRCQGALGALIAERSLVTALAVGVDRAVAERDRPARPPDMIDDGVRRDPV
jgi:hypothetical protein